MKTVIIAIVSGLALGACASLPAPVTVLSGAESRVASTRDDIPDGPAMWIGWMRRGQDSPTSVGFTASTTRAGGLVVTSPDGVVTARTPGPRLGEIDASTLPSDNGFTVLVGGARRAGRGSALVFYKRNFDLDSSLRYWGEVATDQVEPRAFCMRQIEGALKAVVVDRRGDARVFHISEGADGAIQSQETRRFRVEGMGHGCAVDPHSGQVYLGLARGGFARASLSRAGEPVRLLDPTPRRLPRSLGVAYLNDHTEKYLTTLDEDHRAFSVWRIRGDDLNWMGRVEVRERADGRPVVNRGGIDAYGGHYGDFAAGVVVVQDQANDGSPNLKYVDWAEVKRALGF